MLSPPPLPPPLSPPPLWTLLLAGSLSSGIASIIFNPLDIAKTRAQATGGRTPSHHAHTSAFAALTDIPRREGGVAALWRGTSVNVFRSVVFGSVMLTTNFRAQLWLQHELRWDEGLLRDASAALLGATAGTIAMNPVDVVRTRLYNQPRDTRGRGTLYGGSNPVEAVRRIVGTEGPIALWKGVSAHWLRVGPYTMISFVLIGIMRRRLEEWRGGGAREG